jgi:tRNA pseudouridine38-40 synthase
MRYFARLAYNGANYFGWQKQPHQISVQEQIESVLSTVFNQPTEVTGCGRTDTGVHARQYFAHFDSPYPLQDVFIRRINKMLPRDIAFERLFEVHPEAHARFDATLRSYSYFIDLHKNPFATQTAYFFPFSDQIDPLSLQQAASALLDYEDFFPFCKTDSDAQTMKCQLKRSEWEFLPKENRMVYHVTANRFLRGMVRLIVGACLNVAMNKVSIRELRTALDTQSRLKKSWSVPPEGLFLTHIQYPYIK